MTFNIPISKEVSTAAQTFEKVKAAVAETLGEKGKEILAKIRFNMRSPKKGRIYTNGKIYQASAPGEAPAVRTGRLINSLRIRKSNGGLKIRISAEVGHAKFLEHGTKNMAPRPFMKPVVDEFTPIIDDALQSAVARSIKRRKR